MSSSSRACEIADAVEIVDEEAMYEMAFRMGSALGCLEPVFTTALISSGDAPRQRKVWSATMFNSKAGSATN